MLAHGNTRNISAPDLAILAAALEGDRKYNLGALIARHLNYKGEKGPNYGGIFATIVIEHLNLPVRDDDLPLPFLRLDLEAMKRHEFVTRGYELGNLDYMLRFSETCNRTVCLPAPLFFSFTFRNGWSVIEVELDEYLDQQQFYVPTTKVDAPEDEEPEQIQPPPEEPVAQWGKGSSSWARSLLLGRTTGCRSPHTTSSRIHGAPSTIPAPEEAPGAQSRRAQLRPKA